MTEFSIVTVVRNDRPGLEATAESLAQQTCTDFQWIVIDGASTDGTQDALDGLAHRPDISVSEPDNGIYHAMNKGKDLATGEWVQFLNAGDTLCTPETLSRVRDWTTTTQLDWGFGAVRNIDSAGNATGLQCPSPFTTLGLAHGHLTVPHQATFMRRELMTRIGDFLVNDGTAADQEYILRAARTGAPFEMVWPIVDFRTGGAGMGHSVGHFTRSMRRYRKSAGPGSATSAARDAAIDGYVIAKEWLHHVEARFLERRSGS